MAKVAISLKVEPEVAKSLKDRAASKGKNISDLLQEGLFVTGKIGMLEDKINNVLNENQELRKQLGRVNRKPQTTKRVSIPLTLSEYKKLSSAAYERDMSRSAVLRSLLTEENTKSMLTSS